MRNKVICICILYLYLYFDVAVCGDNDDGYYVWDPQDSCRYKQCQWGKMRNTFPCAPGTAVPPGFHGQSNPCMVKSIKCRNKSSLNFIKTLM